MGEKVAGAACCSAEDPSRLKVYLRRSLSHFSTRKVRALMGSSILDPINYCQVGQVEVQGAIITSRQRRQEIYNLDLTPPSPPDLILITWNPLNPGSCSYPGTTFIFPCLLVLGIARNGQVTTYSQRQSWFSVWKSNPLKLLQIGWEGVREADWGRPNNFQAFCVLEALNRVSSPKPIQANPYAEKV